LSIRTFHRLIFYARLCYGGFRPSAEGVAPRFAPAGLAYTEAGGTTMILTTELTQRLLKLGYAQDSANYIVALYMSKGVLDDLYTRLEREEAAVREYA